MTIAIDTLPQHRLLHSIERLPSAEIDVSSNDKQKNSRRYSLNSRPRKVHFAETPKVHEVLHYEDYTPGEYIKTWYTRREVPYLKKEAQTTLRLMKRGTTLPEGYTSRGLENKSRQMAIARRATRSAATMAVLHEQRKQQNAGYFDGIMIAEAYGEQTQHAMKAAIEVAQTYLLEDEEC
eukprot:CAMPEP_0202473940 /NCGR_PEP_ID=MMETSP1360-20130828/92113_1 /ASSEMBLY_ACC=CAM_ASM_000848 /TAXON_ID=515479 /ORGANISM="Licmophora paradoxa, Strain CCMP2313" /LENGTH=178 /DNA_ID=CAMNT_0049101027 /DNA_START=1351 /DNA_END=1887 /DNA_ORIENTATION=-